MTGPVFEKDRTLLMTARGGHWRDEAWDRIGRLTDALPSLEQTAANQVRKHLDHAASCANDSWWHWFGRTGSRIEAVWRELRLAEEAFLRGVGDADLRVQASVALQHGSQYLDQSNAHVLDLAKQLEELGSSGGTPPPEKLLAVRKQSVQVLIEAHEASGKDHRTLRSVGRQVLGTVWILFALAVMLLIAASQLDWEFLPPVSTGSSNVSGWQVVALAMTSGMAGAMFTAIPSVSLIPDKKRPFNPIWRQAGLKVAIGAWSGLIGLLSVTAGLGNGAAGTAVSSGNTTSVAGFIMVAALFGAGQEAVSRFVDRKATIVRDAPDGAASG